MLANKIRLVFSASILFLASCSKDSVVPTDNTQTPPVVIVPSTSFPEKFETGSKTDYTAGNVSLATGSWNMNDAITGNTPTDRKNGNTSIRIQNNGMLTMNFDVPTGASVVSFYYAKYGTDTSSSFELWTSLNSGAGWMQTGNTITASSTTLTKISFGMSYFGNIRFQLRKIGGGQLNIDDFNILGNSSVPSQDDNMNMGNPSGAVDNTNFPDNYLMAKPQFALSYNNTRGTANWLSWHLSSAWKGTAPRCNCFTPDYNLPGGFYQVTTTDYSNTGFDRGHLSPSDDRDYSDVDNAATFLMSNIMPQAPDLNQVTWSNLENYCRTLMNNGYELYITTGGYGSGGTGTIGGVTTTIAGGKITVPSRYWKVIIILPTGSNDAMRVTASTRVIAVDMPNNQDVDTQPWGNYRVSVAALQSILGYDFLSNVSPELQAVLEANADNGPTN